MSLHDQAAASRHLATAFAAEAIKADSRAISEMLAHMANAHETAATLMEQQARADTVAIGGACTLDHSRLKGPARCVCGASATTR